MSKSIDKDEKSRAESEEEAKDNWSWLQNSEDNKPGAYTVKNESSPKEENEKTKRSGKSTLRSTFDQRLQHKISSSSSTCDVRLRHKLTTSSRSTFDVRLRNKLSSSRTNTREESDRLSSFSDPQ